MSSGTWTVIILGGFLLVPFMLKNFRSIGPLSLSRSKVSGLKKRLAERKYGTYSIKFYLNQKAIAFQSTRQDSSDTSEPLRAEIRRVLSNSEELTWAIVLWEQYETPLFRYDGDTFATAISLPGIIGIEGESKFVVTLPFPGSLWYSRAICLRSCRPCPRLSPNLHSPNAPGLRRKLDGKRFTSLLGHIRRRSGTVTRRPDALAENGACEKDGLPFLDRSTLPHDNRPCGRPSHPTVGQPVVFPATPYPLL